MVDSNRSSNQIVEKIINSMVISVQKITNIIVLILLSIITIWGQNGKAIPPPPPPPPPPESEVEKIFRVVSEMPRFPGCEDKGPTNKEREECANKKMMKFFYKNLKYPKEAQQKGITGTVKASFIIERDGETSSEKIVKGLSKECDEEVLRVLGLMRSKGIKWIPQCSRGRPVRILREIELEFSEN